MAEYTKQLKCGCVIRRNEWQFDYWVDYCSLHKSAPKLYKALETLMEALEKNGSESNDVRVAYNLAKPILAEARDKI